MTDWVDEMARTHGPAVVAQALGVAALALENAAGEGDEPVGSALRRLAGELAHRANVFAART